MSARLGVLVLVGVSTTAVADPVADISRCAAVSDRDARLACYDALGARYAVRQGATGALAGAGALAPAGAAGTSAPAVSTRGPSAPAAAAASAPAGAPTATAATGSNPTLAANAAPPVAKTAPSPAEQRADFGLQPNQMPKDPEAPKKITAIQGVVSGFGHAPNGHQVVRLDDSQSWELTDDADALLKPGDKVSIRRALLGSFIMSTPSGREHRVKRLSP